MTDLDLLRAAARLIRDRAQRAATIAPGEWYPDHTIGVYAHGDTTTPGCPAVITDPSADLAVLEHIAGWGPEPALAVADWLDLAASDIHYGRRKAWHSQSQRALAVARAVLAPTSATTEALT